MSLSLDHHLQQKLANQSWLYDCMQGSEKAFPYRPNGGAKALVGRVYTPKDPSTNSVVPSKKAGPQFVSIFLWECCHVKNQGIKL